MKSYNLILPVASIRNTGTFFEGLALKVAYDREKGTVTVSFKDGTILVFMEEYAFNNLTGIAPQDPREYGGIIQLTMTDEDNLRNLLHIAMLSGGEILREPYWQEDQLLAMMEDYNGYRYLMTYQPS